MEMVLWGILVVAAVGICAAISFWLVSWFRGCRLVEHAMQWIPVEATIQSGDLECPRETNKFVLPTFAFSYQVSGEYFAGRFSLKSNQFWKRTSPALVEQMVGRKLLIRHDPDHPERWFIPDEFIDGYKVNQKLGPHLVHEYEPRE